MSSSGPTPVIASISCHESNDSEHNGSRNQDAKSVNDPSTPSTPSRNPFVEFQAKTIAPSPPTSHLSFHHQVDDRHDLGSPLRISTDVSVPIPISSSASGRGREPHAANIGLSPPRALNHKASSTSLHPISRTPSVKAAFANYSSSLGGSSGSIPSPVIAAMGDMTPLPSPLLSSDSPGPWKKLSTRSTSPPSMRNRLRNVEDVSHDGTTVANRQPAESDAVLNNPTRRKQYGSLDTAGNSQTPSTSDEQGQIQRVHHTRNRSVSEYVPEPSPSHRRHAVVSGSHISRNITPDTQETHMRREVNFAESRGITSTVAQPPTPPPSESSKESVDGRKSKDSDQEWFEARGRHDQKRRRWRSVAFLGQGTFSRVMLASSQILSSEYSQDQPIEASSPLVADTRQRKKLVAIKVCEHGPRGGASEERIEMSLKRELEIMQVIHHPSLVNLKAWSIEPTRAILVLSYCPGGDLFDMATTHRKLFTPALLRRVFSELVGAVKYLHEKRIVHRDIKLESEIPCHPSYSTGCMLTFFLLQTFSST